MKQLNWCLFGTVIAGICGAFALVALFGSAAFLAKLPSPYWQNIALLRVTAWSIYAVGSIGSFVWLLRRVNRLRREKEMNLPVKPFVPLQVSTWVVAASTLLLPAVTGYGTVLFQWIVLGAWMLVAKASGGAFADHHAVLTWSLSLVLNVCAFFIPASFIFIITARRWPRVYAALLFSWIVFYLASLFVLFPATDGP